MRSFGSVLVLLAVGAGAAGLAGCGKSDLDVPLYLHHDVDTVAATAKAQNKPVVVFVGASWDTAWAEIERVTLGDPEVRTLLARDFISLHIDMSDDEDPTMQRLTQRFKVIGEPAIIILRPDCETEISRFNEFIPPKVLARALRATR